jgi:hypothetical protein
MGATMKRVGTLGLAIVLTLGLAVTASHAAKAKKVASEVEASGWNFASGEFTLIGDVHSKKSKCEKGRAVTVYAYNQPTDDPTEVGTTTTDGTGGWELHPPDMAPNNYHSASVDRKKIGRGDKKLVCKADESPLLLTD